MFGKLLKYDFRSMFKQFAFIWPAALALALVNRFTISDLDSTSSVGETAAGIAMVVYIAILMAMFIVALIFVIQRFYKGLLGDEGYLMHTLPVHAWQLIGSKLLCAVVTTAVSVLVALLSILLIVPWSRSDLQEFFSGLGYLFSHWGVEITHFIIACLEMLLFVLVCFATGYLQLYLSMGVGHLFNRNRVAMSVVAFIAINVVFNVLRSLVNPLLDNVLRPLSHSMAFPESMASFHALIWILIALQLILCAVYFAGTEFILRKKLNLE